MNYDNKKRDLKVGEFFILLGIVFIIFGFIYRNSSNKNDVKDFSDYSVIMTIIEDFNKEWGKKNVSVINNKSSKNVVFRIKYNEEFVDDNGNVLPSKYNNRDIVIKDWNNEFRNNFTYLNGYFYYNYILSYNEEVKILDSINLDTDFINSNNLEEYFYLGYSISFDVEALLCDEDAIMDYWKVNGTIKDGVVNWNM